MSEYEARVHVSMFIDAPASRIYHAFVQPEDLAKFWLANASGPLQVGQPVQWHFMVEGAADTVTATRLEEAQHVAWRWSDGSTVSIALEAFATGTAVTLVQEGMAGTSEERIESALNGTEGFAIVLCDLKTLLETGQSAGLTRGKARLIEARSKQ